MFRFSEPIINVSAKINSFVCSVHYIICEIMIPAEAVEAVTPIELSKAAALFGTLKQLRIKLKDTDDGILDRAFEIHVQGVLEKLEQRLPTLIDEQLRDVEIIMARHGLYDAAFQQLIILCQNSEFSLFHYL